MRVAARQLAKGYVHVLLGGMVAAAFALLVFAFVTSIEQARNTDADGSVHSLLGLAIVVAIVVVVVATTPPVRPLEVAAARYLLELDLPEVQVPASWSSRRRGAVWLALTTIIGGLALLAVLVLVPIGVGLAAYPFGSTSSLKIPGLPAADIDGGPGAWWVGALSPVPLAMGIGIAAAATVLLRRTAPLFLGPTDADRLVLAERRELELARSNQLAREIHDSVGHALTAIGIQAEAGERVFDRNPEFARTALASIRSSSSTALGELDHVLGLLRGDTGAAPQRLLFDDLEAMIHRVAPDAQFTYDGSRKDLDRRTAADTFRIAQEAMTNAVKHGRSPITLHVSVGNSIQIICRNAVLAASDYRSGRGLRGMEERTLLAGGTLDVAHDTESWTVHAVLPASRDHEEPA